MKLINTDLGFSTADGEQVELSFSECDLRLHFVDWRQNRVEYRFQETLAFRWAARSTVETPSDDETYEVLQSKWLLEEVRHEALNSEDYVHHVLCFNAEKVLEVISRRLRAEGHGQ